MCDFTLDTHSPVAMAAGETGSTLAANIFCRKSKFPLFLILEEEGEACDRDLLQD